jgi:hypothetical protein
LLRDVVEVPDVGIHHLDEVPQCPASIAVGPQQVCESFGHLVPSEARAHSQLGLELFYVLLRRA